MSGQAKVQYVSTAVVRSLVFGVVPSVVYTGLDLALGRGLNWKVVALVAVLGVAGTGAWLFARSAEEIRRSRRRMTDPMYRARLIEFAKSDRVEDWRSGP